MLGFYGGYYCSYAEHEKLADSPPKASVEASTAAEDSLDTRAVMWERDQVIARLSRRNGQRLPRT